MEKSSLNILQMSPFVFPYKMTTEKFGRWINNNTFSMVRVLFPFKKDVHKHVMRIIIHSSCGSGAVCIEFNLLNKSVVELDWTVPSLVDCRRVEEHPIGPCRASEQLKQNKFI